jgi:hypothetical protein
VIILFRISVTDLIYIYIYGAGDQGKHNLHSKCHRSKGQFVTNVKDDVVFELRLPSSHSNAYSNLEA